MLLTNRTLQASAILAQALTIAAAPCAAQTMLRATTVHVVDSATRGVPSAIYRVGAGRRDSLLVDAPTGQALITYRCTPGDFLRAKPGPPNYLSGKVACATGALRIVVTPKRFVATLQQNITTLADRRDFASAATASLELAARLEDALPASADTARQRAFALFSQHLNVYDAVAASAGQSLWSKDTTLSRSILKYQQVYGLPITGRLDALTVMKDSRFTVAQMLGTPVGPIRQ